MALAEDMALLNRVELFRELGDDKLRLIAFGAERRRLQAGQVLFRQDAPADCAFVVANGSFHLSRLARDGGEIKLGVASPGALLGEIALISMVNRSLTAIAAEPSEVMRINRPLFHRMLEEYPEIGDIVHKRLTDNLARMTREIAALGPRFAD
jgi:cAMP-binding proteins - catabolite gene activator and regulatory subunit of cAMP-dependent protein kinases